MFLLKMINFCKNSDCPSSQELLDFQNGESATKLSRFIEKHISKCDFCTAELALYAKFPQSEDLCQENASDIPLPLYELAEAILSKKYTDFFSLNNLFTENKSVKLS